MSAIRPKAASLRAWHVLAATSREITTFVSSIGGKWLELLKEVAPRIARVLVILESGQPHSARGFAHHRSFGAFVRNNGYSGKRA